MKKSLIQVEFEPDISIPGLSIVIRNACTTALLLTEPDRQFELSILVCDDDHICDLNRTYRGVNTATDVLSFEDSYDIPGSKTSHLGDIAISYPTAATQALAAGHSVESEISLLAIHGVLHLLGYDHSTKDEKDVMWSMQRKCLLELGIEIKTVTGDSNDA